MSTKPEPKKTKGMCIATRCTSVEQFIQMFHRFVDEESFFVSTLNTRPPGLETSFSVQLVDGTPVLRGMCVVTQAWTDNNNPFKTPGVRLGIKRLTANSMVVFEQLLVTRSAKSKPNGTPQQVTPVATKPMASAAPKPVTPVTTKPFGAPKLKVPATIAVGVPKSLPPKTPTTETAPTKHPPSRLELKLPARPSTGSPSSPAIPIPEPITPESTDVTEEQTDVREPKLAALAPTPDAGPARDALIAKSVEAVAKPESNVERVLPLPPEDLAVPVAEPAKPSPQLVRDQLAAELDLAKPGDSDDASRTPGSELVLPANPLMNLTDESLEGYVDCTLYEETGNFFPVEGEDGEFVDDVVPPPGLAAKSDSEAARSESRQRTITPLPATPDAYAAARESSPSLVVPPALPTPAAPRESVMVDPELIARGSTPAFEPAPKPAVDTPTFTKDGTQKPSFDADALPLPAAASHDRLVPTPHKRPRWWLLGGVVGLLSVVAAIVVITSASSSDGSSAPPTAKPTKQVAQLAPVAVDDAGSATDPTEEELDEPPPGSGPPMVGEGPCQVVVASTPASSMVAIDGKTVGPTPLTVSTACGQRKVEIRHARYQATSKVVTLTEGTPANVDVTLQRPTHTVTVSSNPSGATIFIDGRSAGTTPTKLNVLGFVTLKLEFKKTGYQPTQAKFYSRYPQDKVTVKLNKW